jgi:hypothetical protein
MTTAQVDMVDSDQHPKTSQSDVRAIDDRAAAHLGAKLRHAFDDISSAPVPEDFLALIEKIAAQTERASSK